MTKNPGRIRNFRDLGGISAKDGNPVKPGVLFRSGDCHRLKEKNILVMKHTLRISHVIDLRTKSELDDNPDRVRGIPQYLHLPLLSEELNPSVTAKTRLSILRKNIGHHGGTRGYLRECYRALVSSERALESMRKIVRCLMENDGGFVWHCTQGKDRTGFCTAVILMLLGSSRETVLKEYLSVNRSGHFYRGLASFGVILRTGRISFGRELNHLMRAEKEYLMAAFEEMDRVFGGVAGYFENGLGISEKEQIAFQEKYLDITE